MQAGRVHFLIFAALMVALLVVGSGSALQWDFQNCIYGRDACNLNILDYSGSGLQNPAFYGSDLPAIQVNRMALANPGFGASVKTTFIDFARKGPFTYVAYNGGTDYFNQLDVYDGTHTYITDHGGILPTKGIAVARNEIKISGDTYSLYTNGIWQYDWFTTAPLTDVEYWRLYLLYRSDGAWCDNLVIDDTGYDPYILGGLPPDWSIRKDWITPSLSGVYDEGAVRRSTSTFWIDWGVASSDTYTVSVQSISGYTANVSTWIGASDYSHGWAGNLSYEISDLLFNTTAPYGLYSIHLKNSGGTILDTSYFWYLASGATISWDKSHYGIDDTAVISTVVSPGYWDPATYTYEGRIVDLYGNVKTSWAVTSQTATHSVSLTGYVPGDYYAIIIAKQGSTEYPMDAKVATILSSANIEGLTINAYANSLLSGPAIDMLQAPVHHTTTASGGIYNLTDFNIGQGIGINATKAAYNFTPFSFTPAGASTFNLTLLFIPDTITIPIATGQGSIVGVVYEDWSHNPIPGATVGISNITWTGTSASVNGAGYYQFDNLAAGNAYALNATAPGYAQSVDYFRSPISGDHIVQNIEMTPIYTLTVTIRDSSTGALLLDNVTVESSDGQSKTTSTGTATFFLPYGAYQITAAASGYTGASQAIVMSSNRAITLYLTKSAAPPQAITYYTQKQVRFKIVDAFGTPLSGANVTANYISTTLPSTDPTWLISAFGISSTVAGEMTNSGLAMAGLTAADGGLVFTMFPSLTYGLTITDAVRGINHYTTIMPQDSDYIIYTALPSQAAQNSSYMPGQLGNTSLFITEPTASTVQFHLRYFDPSGLTTNLKYNVTCWTNMTPMYYVDLGNPGMAVVTDDTYTVPNIKGQEWRFWLNATRSAAV